MAASGIFAERLPVLIDGPDISRMTSLTAPFSSYQWSVIALVGSVVGTWHRTGAERWVPVAVPGVPA